MRDNFTTCTPPSGDRESQATYYLPITEHGLYDETIYKLDSAIGEINAAAFGYDPEQVRSYHEGVDEHGCVETLTSPALLDATPVTEYLSKVVEALKGVNADLSARTDEQWVERAVSKRYALTGSSLKESATGVESLGPLVNNVVTATNDAAKEAFAALRGAVLVARETLDDAVRDATGMDISLSGTDVLTMGATYLPHAVGSFLWNKERPFDPEKVDALNELLRTSASKVENAAASNDEAVQALLDAVSAVVFPEGSGSVVPTSATRPTPSDPLVDEPKDETPPVVPPAPPVTGGGGGGDTPSPDPLEELFNESEPELPPSMSDPGMGGMPSSGMGSPLGGGMPSSGMGSPLGGGTSDPFAAEPLSDMLEDEDELDEEEPLDDLTEEDEDAEDDELFPEDETEEQGDIAADVEVPEADDTDTEGDVEETPENGDVPPVEGEEAPKDDTAARTADVGNGRMVTFPSEKLAQLAADLALPGNENKTLYMAASEAGYQLPPMGQDIGSQVPPGLLREGDIVVNGDNQMGVFLGSGDVLMEGGEIKPLSEVANFGGENQGLFRLEEPTPTTDGLNGPAQPVSDGSTSPVGGDATATVSTPGEVSEDVGTPGVPTDTKADDLSATDDTLAGLNMGETDNGDAGLDPSTAFPS